MKYLAILFLTFISFSYSHAQSDDKAEKLISEVLQKVKSYENINVKFSYNLENKATNTSEETRGEVYIKGEKYRLELDGNVMIYDGNKL